MTVCVDSSLALKWVLAEDASQIAEQLLVQWRGSGEKIIAPPHFYVEIASVLRQRTLRIDSDRLELEDSRKALVYLLSVEIAIHHSPALHQRALDLAIELGQPTTYDTHYLALAEHEMCEFWTADKRLYRAARDRFPMIRFLADDRFE
jgi:predicted nucleic acid-binding protein